MTDTIADRFGHERPCAHAVGVAARGRVVEIVLGGRAEAEARAAELARRHAEAVRLVPEFWAAMNAWAERERRGGTAEDAFHARWAAEQARWLAGRGVHPEDREFVWNALEDGAARPFDAYDVFPVPLAPAPAADARSLGERLRAQVAAREAEHLTRTEMESDEAIARARRCKQAIRDAFEAAKGKVAADVGDGRLLKPIKLPPDFECVTTPMVTIDDPRHRDHHLFLEFKSWAEANGLRATVRYDHDGGGMRSWHELSFAPL